MKMTARRQTVGWLSSREDVPLHFSALSVFSCNVKVISRGTTLQRSIACLICLMTVLGGCYYAPHGTPHGTAVFERAAVHVSDVIEAAMVEADIAARYEIESSAGAPWFTTLHGSSQVLVVAAHATAHLREGRLKSADGGTGALAVMLNRLAGTPAIHTSYRSPVDPNFYDDNEFKRVLATMVKRYAPVLVLDLHASHFNHPYDVDFGTMHGRSLLRGPAVVAQLATTLRREGMGNFSQDYFAAETQNTVTKWVSALGVPAIQCEFNSTWLLPPPGHSGDAILQQQRFAQLLQGLVRFIRAMDQKGSL